MHRAVPAHAMGVPGGSSRQFTVRRQAADNSGARVTRIVSAGRFLDRAETRIVPLPVARRVNGRVRARMEQATDAPLKKTPLNARHRASGAQDGRRLAAGTCRSSTPASSPSTWPCASAPACSTSATWARSRSPARTRSPPSSASPATTPRSSQVGQAQYSGLLTPRGHVRRRPARLPPRAAALPARRQRVAHRRRTTRTSPSTSSRRATRWPWTPARATRCSPCRARARSTSCSR